MKYLFLATLVVVAVFLIGIYIGLVAETVNGRLFEVYSIATSLIHDAAIGVAYLSILSLGGLLIIPSIVLLFFISISYGLVLAMSQLLPSIRFTLYTVYAIIMTWASILGVSSGLEAVIKGEIVLKRLLNWFTLIALLYLTITALEHYINYILAIL